MRIIQNSKMEDSEACASYSLSAWRKKQKFPFSFQVSNWSSQQLPLLLYIYTTALVNSSSAKPICYSFSGILLFLAYHLHDYMHLHVLRSTCEYTDWYSKMIALAISVRLMWCFHDTLWFSCLPCEFHLECRVLEWNQLDKMVFGLKFYWVFEVRSWPWLSAG